MGLKNDFKSTIYGIIGETKTNIVIVNNLTNPRCVN